MNETPEVIETVKEETVVEEVKAEEVKHDEAKETAIAVKEQMNVLAPEDRTMWNDVNTMKLSMSMAKTLAATPMVPAAYKNQPGNCLIAIDFANRMNTSPLMIMQNLDVIQGNPAWRGQACTALVNNCGRFEPIKFEESINEDGTVFSCRAYAKEKATGETLYGTVVDNVLAEKCGWLAKNGSYWLKMPAQMARYRAAAFFARNYCPEALMGLYTTEEVRDIKQDYSDSTKIEIRG